MKKQLLLICTVVMLLLPACMLAQKVSTLAFDVELRSKPDDRAPVVGRVPAGEIVTILESDRPDYWVKVQAPDATIGYIDSGALDVPSGWDLEESAETAGEVEEEMDGIPILRDEEGNLVCAVTRRTLVYYRKDRSNPSGASFSEGTKLSVKEIDKAANQAEVWLNGNIAYVDLSDLEFDRRKFPETADLAAMATPVPQKAVPRDGAHAVLSGQMRVYVGEPYSRDVREGVFQEGDVISGKFLNNKWFEIPFEEGRAYVERKYLRKMKLYELVRMYGEDAPIVKTEREWIARTPGFEVFNGVKSGLYGIWLVIAAAAALGVMTYSTFVRKRDRITPKSVIRYGRCMLVVSVLEIWYFLSLGIDQAAWFLGRSAGQYGWLNFFLLLAVTAVQVLGLFLYASGVQQMRRFTFSQKWIFGGFFISLILFGIYLLTNMNDEIPRDRVAPVLVLCAFAGQIVQILALLISFLRSGAPRTGSPSIGTVCVIYWVALTAIVCVGALSVGLLIGMALCIAVMYWIARNAPSLMWEGMQDTLNQNSRHSQYGALFNRLEHQARTGEIGSARAREIREQLEGMRDSGKECPKDLYF